MKLIKEIREIAIHQKNTPNNLVVKNPKRTFSTLSQNGSKLFKI
jgi:hypothetical protein